MYRIDPFLGTLMRQRQAADALVKISVLGIDTDQSCNRASVAAQLGKHFAEFPELAGGHGRKRVEVHRQQTFVPATGKSCEETRQLLQLRLFQTHMRKAQQLPCQLQAILVRQVFQFPGHHHQKGSDRLNFPAEQRALAGINPVGNLTSQQLQLDRDTLTPDPEQNGRACQSRFRLALKNLQHGIGIALRPMQGDLRAGRRRVGMTKHILASGVVADQMVCQQRHPMAVAEGVTEGLLQRAFELIAEPLEDKLGLRATELIDRLVRVPDHRHPGPVSGHVSQ